MSVGGSSGSIVMVCDLAESVVLVGSGVDVEGTVGMSVVGSGVGGTGVSVGIGVSVGAGDSVWVGRTFVWVALGGIAVGVVLGGIGATVVDCFGGDVLVDVGVLLGQMGGTFGT